MGIVHKVGSSKVRNARKRMEKEHEFLGSLSVQCDDEAKIDLVHNDFGELLPTNQLIKVVSGHSDVMRFVLGDSIVDLSTIKAALGVIASCKATIKRFGG
jgi:hypothetical protein